MFSHRRLIVALAFALLAVLAFGTLPGAAQVETPVITDNPWEALYWDNQSLAGAPIVQRQEDTLAHRWGAGAPAPGISPDNFSARWTNNVVLDGGTYRFTTVSDDGIRVWVDGELLIDHWTLHAEAVDTAVTQLPAGQHQIRVDYFENTGDAIATLTLAQLSDPGAEEISISPLQGPPGTTISVEASGFPANTAVTVGIGVANAEPTTEKTVVTSSTGTLDTTIQLPPQAEVGEQWRVGVFYGAESALSQNFTVTAGQPSSAPGCGNVYVVRAGDYLARIARLCNTTVDAILAANPDITDPSLLRVGQRIVLPGASNGTVPAVSISPNSGAPGSTVTVFAGGFAPNTLATVAFGPRGSAPAVSEGVTTDSAGALRTNLQVPSNADTTQPWAVLVSAAGESAVSNTFDVTGGLTATTAYNLRLRAGPSTDTEILDVVPAGTSLDVLGRTEASDWIQVRFAGQTGWMARNFVSITGDLNQAPVTGRFTSATIYLIELEGAGDGGPVVGCGDVAVPIIVTFPGTQAPLTAALEQLLAIEEPRYGQTGLYNALAQSDLTIEQVTIQDGVATIRLSGDFQIGGVCDGPRVEAQLRQTALQYSTVDTVNIFINGQPIEQLISGQ